MMSTEMAISATMSSFVVSGKFYHQDRQRIVSINHAPNLNFRDELTERRRAMVNKAFAMLDRDGIGQINIQDIAGIYDVSMNPEFLEGRKSREEILQDFLNNFDGAKGNNDGVVTMQEWTDYYTDLSMSTPSDEYFVRMMESTW